MSSGTVAVALEGAAVRFGGKDWIVPPLTLGAIRRLRPEIEALGPQAEGVAPADAMSQLDNVLAIVHAALVRNYPDLTIESLADQLELTVLADVVKAVFEVSGLVPSESAGNA